MPRVSISVSLWTATLGALVLACASMKCRETVEDSDGCTTYSLIPPQTGGQCRINFSSSTFFVKPQSSFNNFKVQLHFSTPVTRQRLNNVQKWYKITLKENLITYELFIDDQRFSSFAKLPWKSPQIEILVTGSISYGPNCRSYPRTPTKPPTTTTTTTTASPPTTKITKKVIAATTQVAPSPSSNRQSEIRNSTATSMAMSPASVNIVGLDRWVFVTVVVVSALLIAILTGAVVVSIRNKQKAKAGAPPANINETTSSPVPSPTNNPEEHVYEEVHQLAEYTFTPVVSDYVPKGSQPTTNTEQRIHHCYANTIFENSDLHYQNENDRPSVDRRYSHDSENSLYGAIV